jgi:signal transduction histidine kinase
VLRFRQARGRQRLQMKWFAFAAGLLAVLLGLALAGELVAGLLGFERPLGLRLLQDAVSASAVGLPVATATAVLKHDLYEIDLVINKTLVYGVMAGFITAVYVAIVVGIGHAVGGNRNLGLSIAATALVAVGFQPVRGRVQRLANRLVYGKRATPYEVLSDFSGGISHSVATEDLLPRMARIVAEGLGAAQVDVWLRVGSELVREATWPESSRQPPAAALRVGDVAVDGADATVEVRHQGELLGVIGVRKSPGEQIAPAESKLLEDLASQIGLVLRNVRLIEELRTSRHRLIRAQDEERRRLERDLHDGAQQRLVAIALAVRMARALVAPEAGELGTRLDQAADQLTLALSELREFARGIHPAILTERGLVPALESLVERSTVPATIESSLDHRLPPAVEATAYFLVSEALANVGKYAKATRVDIRVVADEDELRVKVADDGIGGADPAMGTGLRGLSDRVAAVDGTLEIDSPAGVGTRLEVRIPVSVLAEVTA